MMCTSLFILKNNIRREKLVGQRSDENPRYMGTDRTQFKASPMKYRKELKFNRIKKASIKY